MFKPIKVLAIFSALIALGHGDGFTDAAPTEVVGPPGQTTDVGSTDSSETNVGLLDGHILTRLLIHLQRGHLRIIFGPLGIILKPIFGIVDFGLSPLFFVLRIIFAPILFLLNIVLLPIRGVAGLSGILRNLTGGLTTTVGSSSSFVISVISGLVSYVYSGLSNQIGRDRRKRAVMDSMTGMAWNTVFLPLRFVIDIIGTLFPPVKIIINILTWPLSFYLNWMTGGALSNGIALSTDLTSVNTAIPSFLLNLSHYPQEAVVLALTRGWAAFKMYGLPALDRFFVWASSSTAVPTEIQTLMGSAHAGYSMLHMFGII